MARTLGINNLPTTNMEKGLGTCICSISQTPLPQHLFKEAFSASERFLSPPSSWRLLELVVTASSIKITSFGSDTAMPCLLPPELQSSLTCNQMALTITRCLCSRHAWQELSLSTSKPTRFSECQSISWVCLASLRAMRAVGRSLYPLHDTPSSLSYQRFKLPSFRQLSTRVIETSYDRSRRSESPRMSFQTLAF